MEKSRWTVVRSRSGRRANSRVGARCCRRRSRWVSVSACARSRRSAAVPMPRSSAQDRHAVEAALRAARVWHLRERNYLQLSGGEQRRVQLARVLAQAGMATDGQPAWLLLDEPEAGLDIAHQHFMLRLARQLSRQGHGVIVVLHDLNLAARYADEIALLANGRLLRHGTPGQALDPELLSAVYG